MKYKYFDFILKEMDDETADLNIFDDIGEYENYSGKISGFGPKKLTEQLAGCKAKTLNVHINSMGGDIFDGIAVMNILKNSDKTVNVTVDGCAASAASIIAMAGDTISMPKTATMMVHNCWTIALGNSKELRKVADDMDKIMESAKIAYLDKAGDKLDAKTLDKLLDAESYLSAEDCLKYGLADSIIGKEPEPEEDPDEEKEKPKKDAVQPDFHADAPTHNWFF